MGLRSCSTGEWPVWLQNPDRQDQDEWPEILGTFCQAWADLLTGYMTVISFANGHDMQLAFTHVAPSNTAKWSYIGGNKDRRDLEKYLQTLGVYASKQLEDLRNCNETMSEILKRLTPPAQKRGMFVIRDSWNIAPFTLTKDFQQPIPGQPFWASCTRFLITAPKQGLTTPNAHYHLWVLDTRGPQVGHQRIDSEKRTTVADSNTYIGPASGFSDLCVLPSPEDPNGHFVYFAHEQGSEGYVELFKRGADGYLSKVNWSPGSKAPMFQVRAVTPPRSTLTDDPDRDAMPDILRQGTNHYNSIVYGALRSSSEIYVNPANQSCYVPSPWRSYTGIAVDPYYVWVWGPGGFACATHASVMRCIADQKKGEQSKPRWLMGPSMDHLLYDGEQYFDANDVKTWPATKGLVDFCPCEDGTLFISLVTRKVKRREEPHVRYEYWRTDSNAIYTAAYRIDLQKQTLTVEPYEKGSKDAWVKLPGGEEVQEVQKLPIYCWRLLTGLKEACTSPDWNAG